MIRFVLWFRQMSSEQLESEKPDRHSPIEMNCRMSFVWSLIRTRRLGGASQHNHCWPCRLNSVQSNAISCWPRRDINQLTLAILYDHLSGQCLSLPLCMANHNNELVATIRPLNPNPVGWNLCSGAARSLFVSVNSHGSARLILNL